MSLSHLEEYTQTRDKFESLYVFTVHGTDLDTLLEYIKGSITKVNSISDIVRKKYLNDRLFSFLTYCNNIKKETLNRVFLVGSDIIDIPLTNKEAGVLREYNYSKLSCRNGERYDIEYIRNLFFDLDFRDIFYVKNSSLEHIKVNSTKRKVIMKESTGKFEVEEYLKNNIKGKVLFHGVSSYLKSLKLPNHHIFTKHLDDFQIIEVFDKDEAIDKMEKLNEYFGYIKNDKLADRLIFGNNVITAIDSFMIKTLFCSPKRYAKLKQLYDKASLNFEIIVIDSLESGDAGDRLRKDYKGLLGFTYY